MSYLASNIEFMSQDMKDHILEQVQDKVPEREWKLVDRSWRELSYAGEHDLRETHTKTENLVGIRAAREFKRRKILLARTFGWKAEGQKEIHIDQYYLPEEIADEVAAKASEILGIDRETIEPIIQLQDDGTILYPHRGHGRTSSMFCLLAGDTAKTRWYEETEPFEVYDMWRVPDVSKIKVSTEAKFEIGPWYTFNHYQWHSVHRKEINLQRVNINLNFTTLPYADLEKKLVSMGDVAEIS